VVQLGDMVKRELTRC